MGKILHVFPVLRKTGTATAGDVSYQTADGRRRRVISRRKRKVRVC